MDMKFQEQMHTSSPALHEVKSRLSNTGSVRIDWLQIGIFDSPFSEWEHERNLCKQLKNIITPWSTITKEFSSGQTFWYRECLHILVDDKEIIQIYRFPNTDKQPFIMFCFNGSFFNLLYIIENNNLDKKYICTKSYINRLILLSKNTKTRISRIDLALDILKSKIKPYHVSQYHSENYFSRRGGNPPAKVIGSSFNESGQSSEGSTIYIGGTKADSRITVYEKGKQLNLHDTFPDWVRVEVRMKGKRYELPFNIIDMPTGYFIKQLGKKFSDLLIQMDYLNEAEPVSVKPLPKVEVKNNEQELTKHCKKMFGGLIYHMRENGLSDSEIVSKIIRPVIPKTLQKKEIFHGND